MMKTSAPPWGWRDQAECAGTFTDSWAVPSEDQGAALSMCLACPVASECLEAALMEEGSMQAAGRFGLRGGMTPEQRYALYRARARAAEVAE